MDPKVRARVRARAHERCEYCLLPESAIDIPFHVEHIRSRQHLGDDNPENLALACDRCNLYKGPNLSGVDPKSDEVVELFHPRRQNWSEHFGLEGARIVGQTPTGRATVGLLKMNATPRLRLRKRLLANELW